MALLEDGIFEGLFKDGLKSGLSSGIVFGIGALVLAPAVLSVAGSLIRPVAKAAIKSGLMAYDWSKRVGSEVAEKVDEVVTESRTGFSGKEGAAAEPSPPKAAQEQPSGKAGHFEPSKHSREETSEEGEAAERPTPWIVRGY